MTNVLYHWLLEEWNRCNVPKYRHYFTEWSSNLTESQIDGFEKSRTSYNKK